MTASPELVGILILLAVVIAAVFYFLHSAKGRAELAALEANVKGAVGNVQNQLQTAVSDIKGHVTSTATAAPVAAPVAPTPAPQVVVVPVATPQPVSASDANMLRALLGSGTDNSAILAARAAAPVAPVDRSKNDPFVDVWQPNGDMKAGQSLQTPSHTFTGDTERRVDFDSAVNGAVSVTISVNGAVRTVAKNERIQFKAGDVVAFTVTANATTGQVALTAVNS